MLLLFEKSFSKIEQRAINLRHSIFSIIIYCNDLERHEQNEPSEIISHHFSKLKRIYHYDKEKFHLSLSRIAHNDSAFARPAEARLNVQPGTEAD